MQPQRNHVSHILSLRLLGYEEWSPISCNTHVHKHGEQKQTDSLHHRLPLRPGD